MKHIVRAFSLGLLVASVLIGLTYYYEKSEAEPEQTTSSPSIKESIQLVENEGYFVYEENMEQKVDLLETELEAIKSDTVEETEERNEETKSVEKTITIKAGMTVPDIVEILLENYIIADEQEFITYLEENELARSIQIGEFQVNNQMSMEELVSALTKQTEE